MFYVSEMRRIFIKCLQHKKNKRSRNDKCLLDIQQSKCSATHQCTLTPCYDEQLHDSPPFVCGVSKQCVSAFLAP